MKILRTTHAFLRFTDAELAAFAGKVIVGMTNNPSFTNPLVNLADIAATNTAFETSITAAANGDRVAIADKNNKREALLTLLLQEGAYVEGVAAGDVAVLLSSGFEAVSTNRGQIELEKPVVASVENSASAQLTLRLQPVPTARAYEVRMSYGTSGWQAVGVFTQARRIVLENLTPGTTYTLQARAIGGSTGSSDWSDPVSHMSL